MDNSDRQSQRLQQGADLLCTTNLLYREMLAALGTFDTALDSMTPIQFAEHHGRLVELQQTVEENERQLQLVLDDNLRQNQAIAVLLKEKRQLLESLVACNQKVSQQAVAIKSYLQDELRKSTAGYAALRGYKTSDQQRDGGFKRAM